MSRTMTSRRLILSAVAFIALSLNLPDMARAQMPEAYSRDAMTRALATKNFYELYGIALSSTRPRSSAKAKPCLTTSRRRCEPFRRGACGSPDTRI